MQGEGGGTPPEKGTRLARAECNDSLEQGGREKCIERERGGEREGEEERVQRIERKDDASSADSRASFFPHASTVRTFVCGL